MNFMRTFGANTKCNNIHYVWSHFYQILVVLKYHRRLWDNIFNTDISRSRNIPKNAKYTPLMWVFMHISEQLYKSGRIRPTLSTGQFSNLSKNQCYISRWTLWHIKFGAVTKTEALGVISSFRGWISLYRASRQSVLFFTRYAE